MSNTASFNDYVMQNWDDEGHGHYCLCNDGDIFCSADGELKKREDVTRMMFGEGDVVRMEYSPIENVMRFRKDGEVFEMKVEQTENQTYRMLVYLWS